MERQRDIQKRRNDRHLDKNVEVMVESNNHARHQWIGRTRRTKPPTSLRLSCQSAIGSYVPVQITRGFPTVCWENW